MAQLQEKMTIVRQTQVAENIFELVLSGKIVEDLDVPGQFLHLKVPNDAMLLRRPISISSWDKAAGTVTLLYRAGDETSGTRLFAQLTAGQTVDVMGPLGNGYDLSAVTKNSHVLLVGGGIGVPPLYELAKQLSKIGCQITVLCGFASNSAKILENEFLALPNLDLQIATDDGSYGLHGHVGLLMNALDFAPDAVFACGPNVMLKAVAKQYENLENLQLSLEERMACGIGACYACIVPDKADETHAFKVCADGPVFQAATVAL